MICPTCKKEFEGAIENKLIPSYPFCCETCKLSDLYNWIFGDEEEEINEDG